MVIGGIRIDGSIQEETAQNMRVTQNPVESGETVADNILEEPRRFTMQGVITDTPLGIGAFTDITAYSIGGGISRFTGLLGSSTPSGATRSSSAYQSLRALQRSKQLLTVESNLEVFENLAFENLSVTQDKDTSKAIFFTASFVEVLIVESEFRGIQPENVAGTPEQAADLSSLTNAGTKSTRTLTAAQEESYINSAKGFNTIP